MKITPIGNRVLLKLPELETVTEGGIILPSNSNNYDDRTEGTVVAIGPLVQEREMLNQKVLFEKFAGFEMEIEGEKFTMMFESNILAIR